jgi:drug/metabolite transporter (DMT)-like permease
MLYFITTLLIFASMEVVSKPLMGHIDPFVLTFWRFFAGFLFFLFYPGAKKRVATVLKFSRKEWLSVFFLGILNTFLAMSLLQQSVKYSSAATAATIFCSNPVFVMIIASISGYEKFSLRKIAGMLVGVAAVAMIVAEKGFVINSGALFAVSGAVAFAAYTVLSKRTVSKTDPFSVNMTSFFFGIAANLIFILMSGRTLIPESSFFDISRTVSFLYLGLVVTGIGYVTFFETIKRFTAVSSSVMFMLKPAIAVLFAAVFLKEVLNPGFYAGLLILMIGTGIIFSDKIGTHFLRTK